jgi:hypothetical protein
MTDSSDKSLNPYWFSGFLGSDAKINNLFSHSSSSPWTTQSCGFQSVEATVNVPRGRFGDLLYELWRPDLDATNADEQPHRLKRTTQFQPAIAKTRFRFILHRIWWLW